MDMQKLMDAINESSRLTRTNYHLTLGGLIEELSNTSGNAVVRFADHTSPGEEMSYRGYYSDLSFEKQDAPKTASELLAQCQKALGKTYEGYKGGDYVMGEDTPLWTAPYGTTGEAITDCVRTKDGVLLITKFVD